MAQVLREIGMKVGFTVINSSFTDTILHVSMEHLPVEDILRRILQGENHVIVYRRQGKKKVVGRDIDKIILLGPKTPLKVASFHEEPQGLEFSIDTQRGREASISWMDVSPVGRPMSSQVESWEQVQAVVRGEEDRGVEGTLDTILKAQAFMSLREVGGATDFEIASAQMKRRLPRAVPSTEEDHTSTELDEVLVVTTRLAQENLRALMGGLTAATHSLLHSLENP